MSQKLKVGIICGGKSAEHEVSLQSAKNIVKAADKEKYEIVLIGINKVGEWFLYEENDFLENADDPKEIKLKDNGLPVNLVLGKKENQLISLENGKSLKSLDVVFPVLHGTFGEDGTIQGLLKLADIPFVGPSVLGSSAGMDKDIAKRLLRDSDIAIAKFLILEAHKKDKINFVQAREKLGLPIFVKPANAGSSVGVSKIENEGEFDLSIEEAFKYDSKILLEESVKGRELECSVLGNENPIASVIGEVLPQKDFYSYEAKYIDSEGAKLEMPAKLEEETVKRIQDLAIKTFKVLACEGMARVDFFLTKDNQLVVNEINTIPGFTKVSMYPKLWEVSGIKYSELIDKLIQLALDRFKREKKLETKL